MNEAFRERLEEKLVEHPLLRQLFYERWFRLAFLAFVLFFVFLALFLPKIWRTSRSGFVPVIRVSGLDLVQAWSLKRTAVKATAAGKFEDANYAWQAALANNRADPDLVRGALRSILRDPHAARYGNQAIQESFWLLRLTRTNLSDLELAAQVFERNKYYDPIAALVEPRTDKITLPLASAYLKALFSQGKIEAFNARWQEYSRKLDQLANDSDLRLYHAAYLVGWGPPETMTLARQELDAAAQDPSQRVLAYQLDLALSTHDLNTTEYGRVLKKLEDLREDALSFHIGYWRLLIATGQKSAAARLLQSYSERPTSPVEAVELAQLYGQLDMRDQGLTLLQRYASDFGQAPIFWIVYASELIEAKRWEDLRNVALQIRSQDAVRDPLSAFSYLLEGRAEMALGRDSNALAAFQRATERECPYPALGHKIASQLLQWGHPDLARRVLTRLEKPLGDDVAYWLLLFSVADRQKDVDLLVRAGSRAYELAPHNAAVINNYAAALLISRQNPEQAVKLTVQLLSENTGSVYAAVNHGAALLLNGRASEAQALLSRVQTNGMNRVQLALYNLDLFETSFRLQQYDLAWSISDRIEADLLYPTQQKWLKQTRQQLPPRPKQG